MVRAFVAALLLLSIPTAPSLAQAKFDRAQTAAKLKSMFPAGERQGQEGVMTLGGQFRTVGRHRSSWQQCRDLCRRTPSDGASGCVLWTFVKADDPKVPNVCRMWWILPDLRANSAAVSGAGKVK
jgi:hypothetical protein